MKNELLIRQVKSIIDDRVPSISNLSNVTAVLKEGFEYTNWVGFYLVDEVNQRLYLGPFQGPVACTSIPFNKGICGRSYRLKDVVMVGDVSSDKDHIACSAATRSELVAPIIKNNKVVALIDIDSDVLNNFTDDDIETIKAIAEVLEKLFNDIE